MPDNQDQEQLENNSNLNEPDNQEENLTSSDNQGEQIEDSSSSFFSRLIRFFVRLPFFLKGAIATFTPYFLIAIALFLSIIFLQVMVADVSENFFEVLVGSDLSSDIRENLGNLFTGNGYVSNEKEASEAEKKYFEKLEKIYNEYKDKYGVYIDTTLITATLFYEQGMSDYIENEDLKEVEDDSDLIGEDGTAKDEDIYQGEADFYKLARSHIRTLAKFQVVENTSYNTCTDTPRTKITPDSDKKVADTWVAFYGWNTRATFNYQSYNSISHPKIDGTERNITWCEFKEAKPQLDSYYQEDYKIYKGYKDAYDTCVTSCNEEQECTIDKATNDMVCHSTCDPETACSTQKEEMEKYAQLLENNWGDIYDVETGNFQCQSSAKWGALNSYVGQGFHNYNFDPSWIDRDQEPNFFEQFMASLTSPISCSAKPAITYRYTTSTEREGVYYYKLLSRNTKFLSDKNFIERYYPSQVEEKDPDQSMKDAEEIVDAIYDNYEYVTEDRVYCDTLNFNFSSGSSFMSANRKEFIEMIAPTVVQDMQRTGVLASITIAQAAVESANGQSGLTKKYNNYYGETAGSCASGIDTNIKGPIAPGTNGNRCSGNEYWNGTVVRMCNKSGGDCQWYRVYDGFENSTADHSVTFLRKNFNYCDPYLSDPLGYITCLESRSNHVYATNPNYVRDIMGVINTYNLTQYDIGATAPSVVTKPITNTTTNEGSTTEEKFTLNDWLFIGDSYTDYIRGNAGDWTTDYSSKEGFKVFAQAGNTTRQLYQQLVNGSNDRGDSLPSNAKGIVILVGINDILKEGRPGYDSTGVYDVASQSVTGYGSMKEIIDLLQKKYPSTPIYIQKVFPIGESALGGDDASSGDGNRYWRGTIANVDKLNSLYQNLASNYSNVKVIDTRNGFLSGNGMNSSVSADNVHISPDNYAKWVENIKNSLKSSGAGTSSSTGSATTTPTVIGNCIPRHGAGGGGSFGVSGSGGISIGGGVQGIRTTLDRTSQDYITYWGSSNNIYYSKYVNECTWYAFGRGLEILTKNGMSMETARKYMMPLAHNAWTWFNDNQYFASSTDYKQPKVGAIIVWSNGSKPGHVAVIEDIEYNEAGEITNIKTSEGGQSLGGFKSLNRTLDNVLAHGTYRFIGYLYLLD